MKSLLIAAATALTITTAMPQVWADGPRASGSNAIHEAAQTGTLHYEWQYGYVGHHPRYQGHWVLVQ